MRYSLILITVGALTACSEAQPIACEVAQQEAFACIERVTRSGQNYGDAIFDECVPMSGSQRFKGTWATDFEFNEYYDGKVVSADDAWQHPEPTTRLWGDALEQYTSDDMAHVIEIEFVGRRPLCNFTEPVRDIVVDDLVRARIIERSPSRM